jgi:hypothetical protein
MEKSRLLVSLLECVKILFNFFLKTGPGLTTPMTGSCSFINRRLVFEINPADLTGSHLALNFLIRYRCSSDSQVYMAPAAIMVLLNFL